MKIETILVPTDFSPHADHALELAIGFAKAFAARLVLLHAYDLGLWVDLYGVTFPEEIAARIELAARQKLQKRAQLARAEDVDPELDVVLGTPTEVILHRAKEASADLIVMGTRGLGGLKHVLLGSVAERTLRTAPCPVVTVSAKSED